MLSATETADSAAPRLYIALCTSNMLQQRATAKEDEKKEQRSYSRIKKRKARARVCEKKSKRNEEGRVRRYLLSIYRNKYIRSHCGRRAKRVAEHVEFKIIAVYDKPVRFQLYHSIFALGSE